MTSVTVNINSIDKVKRFVSAITSFDNDFDLVCDRYVIDAKSIIKEHQDSISKWFPCG